MSNYSTTSGSLFYSSDSDRNKNAPINPATTSRDEYWGRSGRYGDHRTLETKDHHQTTYLVHSPGTQYQHEKLLSQAIKPKKRESSSHNHTTTIDRTTPLFPARSASAMNSRSSIPTTLGGSTSVGPRYFFPDQQQNQKQQQKDISSVTGIVYPQTSRGGNHQHQNLFGIAPTDNERSGSAPVFIPLQNQNNVSKNVPAASTRPLNENIARLMFGNNHPQFRSSRSEEIEHQRQQQQQRSAAAVIHHDHHHKNPVHQEEVIVSVLEQYSEDTRQEIEDERIHLLEMKRKFQDLKEAVRRSHFEKQQREQQQKELDDREAEEELQRQRRDREKQLMVINQMKRLQTDNSSKISKFIPAPTYSSSASASPSPDPRGTKQSSSSPPSSPWDRLKNQVVAGGAAETQEPMLDATVLSVNREKHQPVFNSPKIIVPPPSSTNSVGMKKFDHNNNSTMMVSRISIDENNPNSSLLRQNVYRDPLSPPNLQTSKPRVSASPSPREKNTTTRNLFLEAVQAQKRQESQQQQQVAEEVEIDDDDSPTTSTTNSSPSPKSSPKIIIRKNNNNNKDNSGDELDETSRPSESERRRRNAAREEDDEPILAAHTPPRNQLAMMMTMMNRSGASANKSANKNRASTEKNSLSLVDPNQTASPPPAEVSINDEDITTLDIATCAEGLVRYALHQKAQHQNSNSNSSLHHRQPEENKSRSSSSALECAARFHPLLRNQQQNPNYPGRNQRTGSESLVGSRSRSQSQTNNNNNNNNNQTAGIIIISPEDEELLREKQQEETKRQQAGKKQMVLYQAGIASLNAAEYDFVNKDANQLINNCWVSALAHVSARFLTEHKCVARILIELHKRLIKEALKGPAVMMKNHNNGNIAARQQSQDLPPLSPRPSMQNNKFSPCGVRANDHPQNENDEDEAEQDDQQDVVVVNVNKTPQRKLYRREEY